MVGTFENNDGYFFGELMRDNKLFGLFIPKHGDSNIDIEYRNSEDFNNYNSNLELKPINNLKIYKSNNGNIYFDLGSCYVYITKKETETRLYFSFSKLDVSDMLELDKLILKGSE